MYRWRNLVINDWPSNSSPINTCISGSWIQTELHQNCIRTTRRSSDKVYKQPQQQYNLINWFWQVEGVNPYPAVTGYILTWSRSSNLLDMFIDVFSFSSWFQWLPTSLVKSQWFLNLLIGSPGLVWQKIKKQRTQTIQQDKSYPPPLQAYLHPESMVLEPSKAKSVSAKPGLFLQKIQEPLASDHRIMWKLILRSYIKDKVKQTRCKYWLGSILSWSFCTRDTALGLYSQRVNPVFK